MNLPQKEGLPPPGQEAWGSQLHSIKLGGRGEGGSGRTGRHRRPGEELELLLSPVSPGGVLCAVAPRNQLEE